MTDHPKRTCVLVLGMHRSGTSAITRALSLLGAALPKDLVGGNSSNPLGHWEPVSLVLLHDQLLAELGESWDSWHKLDLERLPAERQAYYRQEILRCLDHEFGSRTLFLVKDPRICRFIDFFAATVEGTGIELRYILQVRAPGPVVASLRKRNRQSDELASLLWLRHFLDAEFATRAAPRVVTTYEQLISHTDATLDTLWSAWPRLWPRRATEARSDVRMAIRPELQHGSDGTTPSVPLILTDLLLRTHAALVALSRDDTSVLPELDRLRSALDAYVPSAEVNRRSGGGSKDFGGPLIAAFFYRAEHLVQPLYASLVATADEIAALGAEVVFVNDSPDDEGLRAALQPLDAVVHNFGFRTHTNKTNLGFVQSANMIFELAREEGRDVVLLNSDTVVFSGWLSELSAVAKSDPMIGFVSPRSNNATICTLPHDAMRRTLSPDEHAAQHRALANRLPRVTYVPTAVGFCLYVRSQIIEEFGGFDPIYGGGYNEENDLVMRANECGYRAALANWAFVWHMGEESFSLSPTPRNEREQKNGAILAGRYPQYPLLNHNYQSGSEFFAEGLLGALLPDENGRIRVGFDFTSVTNWHNGTIQAAKHIFHAAVRVWPDDIQIVAFGDEATAKFHGLDSSTRVKWYDIHNGEERVAAILRIGQPFDSDVIRRLIVRSPVIGIMMLDTIAADIGRLKASLNELLWHFVLNWSDAIFGNSEFTIEQFLRRYRVGERVYVRSSLHSADPADYRDSPQPPAGGEPTGYFLIVGNHFPHKSLLETVARLAPELPGARFIALGIDGPHYPNVEYRASGALSDTEIDRLFSQAQAIIFPTHYEGFGFPLMHALARRKPIYVRRLPPFVEVADQLTAGRENIHWFENLTQLRRQLETPPAWVGDDARGELDGWGRSALELLEGLRAMMEAATLSSVAERHRWYREVFGRLATTSSPDHNAAYYYGRLIGNRAEQTAIRLLSVPAVYGAARLGWRALRRLKMRRPQTQEKSR